MTDRNVTAEKELVAGDGEVILRGKVWEFVDIRWCGADPDVGLMSDYVDTFDLRDAEGNMWDWDKDQPTEAENKILDEALCKLVHEPDEWDPYYDYE